MAVSNKKESVKNKEDSIAVLNSTNEATSFLEAYKIGFLDGYISSKGNRKRNEKKLWQELHNKCRLSFEKRFKSGDIK